MAFRELFAFGEPVKVYAHARQPQARSGQSFELFGRAQRERTEPRSGSLFDLPSRSKPPLGGSCLHALAAFPAAHLHLHRASSGSFGRNRDIAPNVSELTFQDVSGSYLPVDGRGTPTSGVPRDSRMDPGVSLLDASATIQSGSSDLKESVATEQGRLHGATIGAGVTCALLFKYAAAPPLQRTSEEGALPPRQSRASQVATRPLTASPPLGGFHGFDAEASKPFRQEKQMQLTAHFSEREFGNPPADMRENAVAVAKALELVRAHVGRPVIVTSGYRDPARNARVGGKPTSAHMSGRAADFIVTEYSSSSLGAATKAALELAGASWDQIIWYKRSRHVHLAIGGRARKQVFCGD